ncbi:Mitochondrial distribution and morphology protein 12 [Dinochytrium kinnereticum]|nr:Mitochondrial distribution and morphology protein 12 [Dinochytrium kinnereticum]
MSFLMNWDLLSDGEVAEKLRSWLNERFQEIERPSFLGSLYVAELDFGDMPPSIEISNICDPIAEFYLPDDFDIYSQSASNLKSLIASISKYPDQETAELSHSENSSSEETDSSNIYHGPGHDMYGHSTTGTAIVDGSLVDELIERHADIMRRDTDIQMEILVDYKGNMRISVSTELIVNQPTPAFMVLPLTLTLTGFSFQAVAMISYLGDRINFCFKEPTDGEGLFKDISIDSEVGDRDRQVLKNVSKIEKFIVEQVRELVSRHLIYPNYHCLSLIRDEQYINEGRSDTGGFETQSV